MSTEVDLRQLVLDRESLRPISSPRRNPRLLRYSLPAAIVGGFLAMFTWSAGDWFVPATKVTAVPVLVSRAEVQESGTPLFQAAGWIEPRPTAVLASALAEGIVDQLLVVEGESVEAGQTLAKLIDRNAKLDLQQAQAERDLILTEITTAQAEVKAAQVRFENPVHLQAVHAEAVSQLAKTETELTRLPFLTAAARARSLYTQQDLEGKQNSDGAIAKRSIQLADRDHKVAVAELEELKAKEPRLEQERDALRKRSNALEEQAKLLVDETRQVETARARLKAAEARHQRANVVVQMAELRLERMIVKSPISGRVLALIARPGTRVMGLDPGGEQRASTILSLYNPKSLQVRADVRLEDVPLMQVGQPVRIETASLKGTLEGHVIGVTSQANVQKNTLEVKVAINAPPETIRPEMLVATSFLAPKPASEARVSATTERLLIPRSLIQSAGEEQTVWIVDPRGYAQRRTIRTGSAGTQTLVEVIDGLTPTDRLISEGRQTVQVGTRVQTIGEDQELGIVVTPTSR